MRRTLQCREATQLRASRRAQSSGSSTLPHSGLAATFHLVGHWARLIVVLLIALWLLGFALRIGGAWIHLLLAAAMLLLIVQLLTGRRLP